MRNKRQQTWVQLSVDDWNSVTIHISSPRGKISAIFGIWLVVDLPLWKIWKSVGMIIPSIWKNKTCSKPPTSYLDALNYPCVPLFLVIYDGSLTHQPKMLFLWDCDPCSESETIYESLHEEPSRSGATNVCQTWHGKSPFSMGKSTINGHFQ